MAASRAGTAAPTGPARSGTTAARRPAGTTAARRPASTTAAQRPAGTTAARRPAGAAARRPAPRRRARRRTLRSRLVAPTGRWRTRLQIVVAVTACLLTALAYAPSDQSVPVAASVPPTDLTAQATAEQTALATAADRYRQQMQTVTDLGAQLALAQAAVQAARAQVDAERVALGSYAAEAYRAPLAARSPLSQLSVHDGSGTAGPLHLASLTDLRTDDRDRQVARVQLARAEVQQRAHSVQVIEGRLATGRRAADAILAESRARTAALDPGVAARLATLDGAVLAPEQAAADQAALASWQAYLAGLDAAGVVPPAAARLADPANLPAGLTPVADAAGDPIPGVATAIVGGRPETLLPAETVAALSTAFAQVGTAYAADPAEPGAASCGGYTAAVWSQAGYGLPTAVGDQWTQGTAVPTGSLQVGDLVFSADPTGRWSDVGIYLGPGTVLGSSAATHRVGVRSLVTGPTAAVRVTLGQPAQPNAAPETGPGTPTECGAAVPVPGPVSPAWGGYANGRIPTDQLCAVAEHQVLRCDAATAYLALAGAYQASFGVPMCITDSYRSYAAQVAAHLAKGARTAVPGTSNHGWGLAVDLCGGINHSFSSPEYLWMAAHAADYGWINPVWARTGPGGEKPEPWHWEYGNLLDTPAGR